MDFAGCVGVWNGQRGGVRVGGGLALRWGEFSEVVLAGGGANVRGRVGGWRFFGGDRVPGNNGEYADARGTAFVVTAVLLSVINLLMLFVLFVIVR